MGDGRADRDQVGYSARPHHAVADGLTTTTSVQRAARQEWADLIA